MLGAHQAVELYRLLKHGAIVEAVEQHGVAHDERPLLVIKRGFLVQSFRALMDV